MASSMRGQDRGPKVWNDLDENIKGFSLSAFKNKLKRNFLESY